MDTKDKDIKFTESEIFTPIELDFTINVAEIMAAKDAEVTYTEEPSVPETDVHLDDVETSDTAEFSVQEILEHPEPVVTSIGAVVGPGYVSAVGPKFVSGSKTTEQKLPKRKKKRKKTGINYEQLSKPKKVLYDLMMILIYSIMVFASIVVALGIVRIADVTTYDIAMERTKASIQVSEVDVASSLQGYTASQVISEEAVPNYTLEEIYALDLRQPSGATEADLKQITRAGLVGLEDTFLEAEKTYGVNAVFLIAIASVESGYGTQMYRPNNMFGYGGKSYPSKEACIMDVAQGLSSRYLTPGSSLYGGSPTVKGVNKRYAANTQWYAKVGKYMHSYYSVISPYHNQMLEKIQ